MTRTIKKYSGASYKHEAVSLKIFYYKKLGALKAG